MTLWLMLPSGIEDKLYSTVAEKGCEALTALQRRRLKDLPRHKHYPDAIVVVRKPL